MIVSDSNLLVYLLLPGEHTEAAEAVLARDPEWAAPPLWRSEFRNVLALYLRKGILSLEAALDAFGEAERLVEGREYAPDTTDVMRLVASSACSAYDCELVALAQELGVPLVTSDGKVLREFPGVSLSPGQFSAS
ncbi:MAG TPA: type II toxin-antitoxin system VapC family toxin [Longimicrobium sp.]|nr:type II toxin-antitoxin system VapC family toxin [Longimicrobium sp.]